MAEKRNRFTAWLGGANPVAAPKTSNAVADREDTQKVQNGVAPNADKPFETFRNVFGSSFTPPIERPQVAALMERFQALNPGLLPARAESAGIGGLGSYLRSLGAEGRDVATLFHPQPPTNVQFPRATDSQNIPAVPPRFTMLPIFRIFSRPRAGTPGANPGGVNTTPTA